MSSRKSKTTTLYLIFLTFVALFIIVFIYRATIDRQLPSIKRSEIDTAIRGKIITDDNFTVASSHKVYRASINTNYLDPNKKDLFVKLYSIYSGSDPKYIMKKINSTKGYVVLSDNLDAMAAAHLKELSKKLYKNSIFVSRKNSSGTVVLLGLDIEEEKSTRAYLAKKSLTPILGHINSRNNKSGLEEFYNNILMPESNATLRGLRDIGGNIILSKSAIQKEQKNGDNIIIGVPLKLQVAIESILDEQRKFLDADEITAAVMNSSTGQIISLASSRRYDPEHIKPNEISALRASAVERTYEPGSVMKPFIFALLLEHKNFNPYEIVNTHNGVYKLGKKTVTDTHKFPYLSAENIIVESSNIGMIELSSKLNGFEMFEGLRKFGFGLPSGIDLRRDATGVIPRAATLDKRVYKATVSYGYGISVTFMQLLKAFNVFNNKGVSLTPHIIKYDEIQKANPKNIVSQEVAKQMKRILIKVVDKGTGSKAKIEGLEIGGKTGTAHISENGQGYSNSYNGSFFGFANDNLGNKYTIGVVAIKPKRKGGYYFGSQSALPSFKKIVEILVDFGYLNLSKN